MSTSVQKKPIIKQFVPISGVTGEPLDSIGSISVNLNIGHKPMTHSFQVVRNSTKALMVLIVDSKELPLVGLQQSNVTVSSTVTIPAMSEMVIPATLHMPLKGLVPHASAGVFEPHHTDHSSGFAWTVAKPAQGSIYVKVANPSSTDTVLHCGSE